VLCWLSDDEEGLHPPVSEAAPSNAPTDSDRIRSID
jgi:hypothetical protein